MNDAAPAYGLWSLAIINSVVFILFALSFAKPQSRRDWRSFSAFAAFMVALFVEMYGFPLTIYLISGWLQSRYPQIDLLSHDAGHLWSTIFGFKGDPHFSVMHILSYILIAAGFILIGAAWRVLHAAQQSGTLAIAGAYDYVRHPQYVGFVLVLLGFLVQWPTLLTLAMFPVLVVMYVRLAKQEEREVRAAFGETYDRYAARVPAFVPRWSRIISRTSNSRMT
jgi:protein-S-isoprenylcysteine O-methyltransferase Ste14